jgi:hypothetical protein
MLLLISSDHRIPASKALRRARLEHGGDLPPPPGFTHTIEVSGTDPTLGFSAVLVAMVAGESVFVPVPRTEENGHRSRIMSAARRRQVAVLTRFGIEGQTYGMRVWRLS